MSPLWIEVRRGQPLAQIVDANQRVEQLGALRWLAMHALAAVGSVLWAGVAFPRLFSEGLRNLALSAFVVVAAVGVLASIREWRWRRILRRAICTSLPGPSCNLHDHREERGG